MARAGADALVQLASLLVELREIPDLNEIKPGIFYVRRLPMLHFHEDETGIVADLKCVTPVPAGFDRFPANSASERRTLLKETVARCGQLRQKRQ